MLTTQCPEKTLVWLSLSNTSLPPFSYPHKPAGKKEMRVNAMPHTSGGGGHTEQVDYSMSTYVMDLSEVSRWEDGHQKQSREVDEQRCATSSKRHPVCQSGLMVRRVDQCIRSSPWIVLGERSAHHLFGGGGEGAALGPFPVSWNVFHLSDFPFLAPPFANFPPRLLGAADMQRSSPHGQPRTACLLSALHLRCYRTPVPDGCCSCACHGQEGREAKGQRARLRCMPSLCVHGFFGDQGKDAYTETAVQKEASYHVAVTRAAFKYWGLAAWVRGQPAPW